MNDEIAPHRNPKKTDRIEVRVPKDTKRMVEQAAALSGQTLSGFIMTSLLQSAQNAIGSAQATRLNREESHSFFELIANAPKPNTALRKANVEYIKRISP